MRRARRLLAAMLSIGIAIAIGCAARPPAARDPAPVVAPAAPGELHDPGVFAAIADRETRSRAIFREASRVLLHARCVNCHPPDDTPRQGDDSRLHDPPIARGTDDRGVPALRCQGCHQDHNLAHARVPGAPGWHLAPLGMAWLGRTPAALCAQLKDPRRNGGRSLEEVHRHLAHDRLVGWAWDPGHDRTPAPGTQAKLGALVQAWIDTGAACPGEEPR